MKNLKSDIGTVGTFLKAITSALGDVLPGNMPGQSAKPALWAGTASFQTSTNFVVNGKSASAPVAVFAMEHGASNELAQPGLTSLESTDLPAKADTNRPS